jgi:DNA-binding response OmpR family regulator
VVLNWELPDFDGPELVRRLRARPGGEGAWVLMLSARERSEDRAEAFEAGVNDYMTKPLEPGELRARVRAAARLVARIEDLEQFERMIRRPAA